MTEETNVGAGPTTDQPPQPGPGSPPPHSPPPSRPWVRPADNRVIAGVASGVAYRLGLDPILVRVLAVVLTLFGGLGVILYAVGWLLMTDQRSGASVLNEAMNPQTADRTPAILLAAGLGVLALVVLGSLLTDNGPGLVLLALVLIGVAFLIRRGNASPPAQTGTYPAGLPATGAPMASAPTVDPSAPGSSRPGGEAPPAGGATPADGLGGQWTPPTSPTAWDALGSTPPPGDGYAPLPPAFVPEPPAPTGRLGVMTFFLAVLAVGVLGIIDATGTAVPAAAYPATVLTVAGIGLIVGTWWGRARGLIALGILAALAMGPALAWDWATDTDFSFESAPRDITPTSVAEVDGAMLEWGAGQATYDLSEVDFSDQDAAATIDLVAGDLTVILPEEVTLDLDASVGAGNITTFGRESSGLGVEVKDTFEGSPDGGVLELTVDMLFGNMEVVR